MYIRNEIVAHFRKRGGIGPDTTAVRRIAEIYEFAFERRFSINPRENCSNRLCYTLRTIVVAMVDVR